jgi:hypothetical protein
MSIMRILACAVFAIAIAASSAVAQPTSDSAHDEPANQEDEKTWSGSVSAYTYVLPDEANYVQPTMMIEGDWLHLEARVNYEDLDTGSAWVGYNLSAGEQVTLELTPMVAAVFGTTAGIAAGYRGSLTWRRLDLSSEAEYMFDAGDAADNFLYTWSELGWSPSGWFRTGVVVQRTKAYQTEFDIQRGLFASVSLRRAQIAAYVLNPDANQPTVVLGVIVGF